MKRAFFKSRLAQIPSLWFITANKPKQKTVWHTSSFAYQEKHQENKLPCTVELKWNIVGSLRCQEQKWPCTVGSLRYLSQIAYNQARGRPVTQIPSSYNHRRKISGNARTYNYRNWPRLLKKVGYELSRPYQRFLLSKSHYIARDLPSLSKSASTAGGSAKPSSDNKF